jgi:hypothetical protein
LCLQIDIHVHALNCICLCHLLYEYILFILLMIWPVWYDLLDIRFTNTITTAYWVTSLPHRLKNNISTLTKVNNSLANKKDTPISWPIKSVVTECNVYVLCMSWRGWSRTFQISFHSLTIIRMTSHKGWKKLSPTI